MKLLQRLRRQHVDPAQPHAFRLANDGYRVVPGSLPAPGGDGSGVHMLAIRQEDGSTARCEVRGCGRRHDDPIHQLDD
jgi:hypothetical protein